MEILDKAKSICKQIAVDGPAASGKSTASRLVAQKIGAFYVNSGDLYRALTWLALNELIDPEHNCDGIVALLDKYKLHFFHDEENYANELHLFIDTTPVDRTKIRSPKITEKVSFTARIPQVREWMIDVQRNVRSAGLVVMEGRDIGTVIFPDAYCKFFITATPEERARRRLQQSDEVCSQTTLKTLAEEIEKRDKLDSTRAIAPLKAAQDALVVDTTNYAIDEVVKKMVATIEKRNS